eukprot:jgi/Ulvmu1/12456/UM009_0108.1
MAVIDQMSFMQWCVVAFSVLVCLNAGATNAAQRPRMSTAETAAEFEKLSQNVTDWYFSNDEIELFLNGLADAHPDLVSVFSIGESGSGAPLLAIDVGTSAGEIDLKPRFMYVGNMHGDEPTGRQLCLGYALDLVTSSSALADDLRERTHNIIIPTLNPDGFDLHTRGSKDGVDLNRAFPDRSEPNVLPSLPTDGTEPPEVLAITRLATSVPLTGAASLHEGAVVAVIPWDGDETRQRGFSAAPDNATFAYLAQTYADAHPRMAPQTPRPGQSPNLEQFPGGVTNGNAWYPVYHGLQDWLYVATGCRGLTLELSENKWPSAVLLPSIWEENQAAMPALAAAATLGGLRMTLAGPGAARATARAGNGLPVFAQAAAESSGRRGLSATGRRGLRAAERLRGAGVAAGVIAEEESADVATGAHGEVGVADGVAVDAVINLPLAPGIHNVSIAAPGALPESRVVEIPEDGGGTVLHVRLVADPNQPADHGQHAEDRAGESVGPAQGFPYAILRGRGGGNRRDAERAMPPELQMGAGVHQALVGDEDAGVTTGGNHDGDAGRGGTGGGAAGGGGEGAIGGQAAELDSDGEHADADVGEPGVVAGGLAGRVEGGVGGGVSTVLAGKLSERVRGSFQDRVHDTLVGAGTVGQRGAGLEAEVDPAAEIGQAQPGAGTARAAGAAGAAVVVVVAERPHSGWWRALRGAIAAAGAVFIAVQVMRLYGRPLVPLAAGGSRSSRGLGQTVTHGHHSFHHRAPGSV